MKPGTSEWTKPRHNKIKAEVYKIKIDKETGKEISRELYYTDTYRAFTGQITIGPSATPKPETTPPATTTTTPATPTPSKSEAATPTPGNTTSPETGGHGIKKEESGNRAFCIGPGSLSFSKRKWRFCIDK